ncbi:ribbon-helix-helix domain-containing protein [Sphingomonas sp. A2-49]|uniref:ribbon-helix-helix domain-containing protein n=1 Tax=Sphingomonas sp. A2-49 TaxID=1391375 RepID=UPI0021D33650|nr:ribbon-helix-helix domain-containing protein [Sphingomonas sp. A2-49]MCU6454950.1 ribbon-helix-helix domain-containing protein [Sphingomonas sp. A2-49]
MRTLIDLPEDDMKWLDRRAAEQGKSRAALVREAVSQYRAEAPAAGPLDWLEKGFGLWARHGIVIDPAEYDRRRRAEWTRPWDDDYEEVRAESPDCFTPEDDRERAHYLALMAKSAVRTPASDA